MGRNEQRPKVLVSCSAVGFYGDRGDEVLTSDSPPGNDFLANLCVAWERSALAAKELGVRVVCLRIGIVFGRGGGALSEMMRTFKLGLGGPIGTGRQYVPWVHREDIIRLIDFSLDCETLSGPVNATAPEPIQNRAMARAFGRVLRRPAFLPVPVLALRLMFGEAAGVLAGGQRTSPQRLQEAGFSFKHQEFELALRELLGR